MKEKLLSFATVFQKNIVLKQIGICLRAKKNINLNVGEALQLIKKVRVFISLF